MKNFEVLYLTNALKEVDAPEMEPSFNYAIAATLSEASRIAEDIRIAIAPSEEYSKFEGDVQALREKYAEKDEKGESKFIIDGNGNRKYLIPDIGNPKNPFTAAVEKLEAKNKDIIEKRDKQLEFLNEENKEFKPTKIEKKDLPKGLSRAAMDTVYMLMKYYEQDS